MENNQSIEPVAHSKPKKKKKKLPKVLSPLLWVTVILPTLFSAIYFGAYASDVYISESSFVVRSPRNQNALSGMGLYYKAQALLAHKMTPIPFKNICVLVQH